MTKIHASGRATFITTQRWTEGAIGKLSLAKMACIMFLFCAAETMLSSAQTFTTLASFDGTDGVVPYGSLVQGLNGNLYGTTYSGGSNDSNCGEYGCGTVFEITPAGELTRLYSFCSQTNCTDGFYPHGGLVLSTNGNFYGTTDYGGANGGGTVFEITPKGKLTTLYNFCSQTNCADGDLPFSALVQATNGSFYGTTEFGGANDSNYCSDYGCGTVFELSPVPKTGCPSGSNTGNGWCETLLYSFCSQTNCTDGYYPEAGLVQATNGNFYGTTPAGGAVGYGTVFKITPTSKLTTLYSFCSEGFSYCTDGKNPSVALVQATNGNFYGTTPAGGEYFDGDVFEITPAGTLTTLYSFCPQPNNMCADGHEPLAALVQATDGNFYGTTAYGGGGTSCYDGCGTVFEVTSGGTLTTPYSFCSQAGCADGEYPLAGLVQATNGNFYGMTSGGGGNGDGTVFSLSVGLGPFVETLPTSGKVGAAVKILGTDLTGATGVTFDGMAATFIVVSSTEITTTVPTGATSGTVLVTTPSGTLNSNVVFRVAP